MGRSSWGVWARFVLLVLLLVGGVVAATRLGVPDVETLRSAVSDTGATGWVVFVVGYVAGSLLVLPKGVLSIAAGLVFGLLPGIILVVIGAMLGASAAFFIGRFLGRDAVERMAGDHLARLDALIQRHGFAAILLVRLIPLIPFTVINYVAGLTSISYRSYALGTLVGILPGTAAYVALGAYGTQPGSWQFAGAIAAFELLTVVGVLAARRQRSTSPAVSVDGTVR